MRRHDPHSSFTRAALAAILGLGVFAACSSPTEIVDTPTPTTPTPGAGAALAVGAAGGDPKAVVAVVDGQSITLGELDGGMKDQLAKALLNYQMALYETRSGALDLEVERRVLAAEAKKRGLADADALVAAEVNAKVVPPSDDELRAFYEKFKEQMEGQPFEAMVEKMRGYLIGQQTQARHGSFVNDLRKTYGVKVTLDPVRLPVEAKGPGRGAEKPKVTIVMWSDFQCPYCVRAEPTLTQLLATFPNDVRVVFRHFPLNFHEHAMPAAEASACADEQGQFWPLHDWFVSGQSDLTRPATRAFLGQRPGFDLTKFDACLTSGRGLKVVEADQAAGERLTVDGTPAFFVNGIKLGGALPYDQFEALVKTELARQ